MGEKRRLCAEQLGRPPGGSGQRAQHLLAFTTQGLDRHHALGELGFAEHQRKAGAARIGTLELRLHAARPVLAASVLPVIGVLFRTIRGAFEWGRNENRYLALEHYLTHARELLREAPDARGIWYIMQKTEDELADEHRSWMRLMIEAEWYG